MKEKIAIVTPFYLPARLSGSGTIVQELAEGLAQKGYSCSVITSDGLNTRWWYDPIFGKKVKKRFETINGVRVYRLPCRQIISFPALVLVRYFKNILPQAIYNKLELLHSGPNFIGLSNLLNKEKFSVIYSSPFPLYLNKQVAKAVQKLSPKPRFILGPYFHTLLSDYHNQELKQIFDAADLVHVATNSEKKDVQKIFKVTEKKFARIPHFLNLTKMKESETIKKKVNKFKDRFKLKDRKIILFAGNKIYMKGVFTLLNVVNRLHKKDPSYILITIGNDSPEWNRHKKHVNPDSLLDLGYVEEKQKEVVFGGCNIFCMPSLAESFGLTYLEAWHKKKPVIGANIPAVKELIYNTNGGLLVEFGNEKNLEEAIKKLALNPSLAKKLGENGYKVLITKYDSGKVIPKFENIFK